MAKRLLALTGQRLNATTAIREIILLENAGTDETPEILKNFIAGIENQMDHKVKTIRCDNGTEFKNRIMNKFCEMKGTKANIDAGKARKKIVPGPQYVLIPLLNTDSQGLNSSEDKVADDAGMKSTEVPRKENGVQDPTKEGDKNDQEKDLKDQEEALRKQFKQESE
nr:putative ribonuclease H-like domain-containing protein [Tanacetum cinerariifolium]